MLDTVPIEVLPDRGLLDADARADSDRTDLSRCTQRVSLRQTQIHQVRRFSYCQQSRRDSIPLLVHYGFLFSVRRNGSRPVQPWDVDTKPFAKIDRAGVKILLRHSDPQIQLVAVSAALETPEDI